MERPDGDLGSVRPSAPEYCPSLPSHTLHLAGLPLPHVLQPLLAPPQHSPTPDQPSLDVLPCGGQSQSQGR